MSGTSMDGIDVAMIRTDGEKYLIRGANGFFAYPHETRKMLEKSLQTARKITARHQRPEDLKRVEQQITHLHVEAVRKFLADNRRPPGDVDVLGFHGQTILHQPENALTVQLGDGALLASETGIRTVFDMRANDMQHGGQGAPMVPVYHEVLANNLVDKFKGLHPLAFVNIGGISNVTYVGDELIAFDTGPGNALIDQWVQRQVGISHDQGGMIAEEGHIDEELVAHYLSDPFFSLPIPKSLDRNDFGLRENHNASVETVARSLARVSAEAVLEAARHFPKMPALWIICGGGRLNPHIMNDLKLLAEQRNSRVVSAENAGFDGDSMEAEAWGYLAVRSLEKLPLTFPLTTGVDLPVTGGVIADP